MAEIEQITIIDSYAEALLVENQLKQEEIPFVMQGFNDPAFGSFWRKQEGWGIVLAPIEYREQVLEIVDGLRSRRIEEET